MQTVHLSAHALLSFGLYWVSSLALLGAFAFIYMRLTPYDELAMIRAGKYGPALSLSGALLGFALPLLAAIVHSANLAEMIIWALISFAIQLAALHLISYIFSDVQSHVADGDRAAGMFLGIAAVLIGLVTAACMTP